MQCTFHQRFIDVLLIPDCRCFSRRSDMASASRLPIALHLTQHSLPPSSAIAATSSPVEHLTEQALKADYDLVCVPLANDLWRERWERLCLRAPDDEEDVFDGNHSAEAKDWVERERARFETAKEAEAWRSNASFKRSELNITKLGEPSGACCAWPLTTHT